MSNECVRHCKAIGSAEVLNQTCCGYICLNVALPASQANSPKRAAIKTETPMVAIMEIRPCFNSTDRRRLKVATSPSEVNPTGSQDKTLEERTTFGSCDVEKVHAVVARSTFQSENVQTTPFSEHFWKLRCRKSARRCGAKHISK